MSYRVTMSNALLDEDQMHGNLRWSSGEQSERNQYVLLSGHALPRQLSNSISPHSPAGLTYSPRDKSFFSYSNSEDYLPQSQQKFMEDLFEITNDQDPLLFLENFVQIAEGSSSVVLRANEISTGRMVAIKKINVYQQRNQELLLNEVQIMRTSSHPNVISFYDSFFIRNELWIVMEYMEGGNLADVVARSRMVEQQIATVSKLILEALSYLHSIGVIHRDIKSDSILIRHDGLVKLSDFGFSVQLTSSSSRRNSLVGTPYWMSPEVISKEPYDFSADVWSFGITVFEMIDGEPPYFNEQPFKAMRKIKEGSPPKLRNLTKVSPRLQGFVEKMITKDVRQRPTASELLLHPFLQQAVSHFCVIPLLKKS